MLFSIRIIVYTRSRGREGGEGGEEGREGGREGRGGEEEKEEGEGGILLESELMCTQRDWFYVNLNYHSS